jgi:hypothetical protein
VQHFAAFLSQTNLMSNAGFPFFKNFAELIDNWSNCATTRSKGEARHDDRRGKFDDNLRCVGRSQLLS